VRNAGALADELGFLLARAGARAIRDLNRALEDSGLRSRHYTVLLAVTSNDGLSQRELGELLSIDPSAVVSLVDDLQKRGLVRRDPHPVDRRTRSVVPTEAGEAMLATMRPMADNVRAGLLAALDQDEQEQLMGLIRRVALG
jgi:DNA-binding MarR family transcriptional regulator